MSRAPAHVGGLAVTKETDLQQEILHLSQIIAANQAALRTPTVSDSDKAQLRRSIGQREARVAILQEQIAKNSRLADSPVAREAAERRRFYAVLQWMHPRAGKAGLPLWQDNERQMPERFNPPNRSDEYRKRAEEARAQADSVIDEESRRTLLQTGGTWERMAECEDKHNPPKPAPRSN